MSTFIHSLAATLKGISNLLSKNFLIVLIHSSPLCLGKLIKINKTINNKQKYFLFLYITIYRIIPSVENISLNFNMACFWICLTFCFSSAIFH